MKLIDDAKRCLNEALDRWHNLRDPEPTEDNNFKHPGTGKEYNYRAAETWQILQNLAGGMLTQYPLKPIDSGAERNAVEVVSIDTNSEQENAVGSPTVFISYSHKDEPWKDRICTQLGVLVQQNLIDTWEKSRDC